MSMKLWLNVQFGDEFISTWDGDRYTVREALCDIKCRRCDGTIATHEPYARGSWYYSKFHIHCAKEGVVG